MALRVLAHFTPGSKVTEFLTSETDWLDIRYCAEDDACFYRELPEAEVIWHVLRPISGDDLEKAPKLKLVHKMGAGVNTIDVGAAPASASRWRTCPVPTRRRSPRAPCC